MKRIFATGSIAALAMIGFAGTANAAPAELPSASCFGQVHKAVNDGLLAESMNINNVGDAVKALGGQGKNTFAKGAC